MTMYEYYKDQYKRTAYPLIDEHQFDMLVAEIRAENQKEESNQAQSTDELRTECLKVGKWYYCYKDLTVPNEVRNCCVPTKLAGNFVFDGKFLVLPNTSLIVDDDYVSYDLNSTVKYEPAFFDKIENFKKSEKNPRRMTRRELAHWCADGNGEWTNASMRTAYQHFDYDVEREAEEVSEHIKIRAWNEDTWHEPLIEE